MLKRLDVTSRSLIAVDRPGSCFAGLLLEVALARDRQYMLDGASLRRRSRTPSLRASS
jgi:benzoyl-CoA-dihydrodiol lyase